MERLTNNKKAFDMSFFELAHNSCYADENRNARYRDYELDIDIRELVKNLAKDMCDEDLSDMSDEELRQAIYELEDTTMLRLGQMSREELEKEYDGIEVDMDE